MTDELRERPRDPGKADRVTLRQLREVAERVRVARTMAAAFPSPQRQQELEQAIAEFNELRGASRETVDKRA